MAAINFASSRMGSSSSDNYGSSGSNCKTPRFKNHITGEYDPSIALPGAIYNSELNEIKSNQILKKWPVIAKVNYRPFYFLRDSQDKLIYADDVRSARYMIKNDLASPNSFLHGKWQQIPQKNKLELFKEDGNTLLYNDTNSDWLTSNNKISLSYITPAWFLVDYCDYANNKFDDFKIYQFELKSINQNGGKRTRRVRRVKKTRSVKRVKRTRRTRKN